ncbi:MAG: glycosyltransferase family 4 protein, partial [Chloroflexi bacterium]|nr:glycosyltransferase family 4 protein [Chloroflexota bacterium]
EGGYWKFLGNLSQLQLAAFYPNMDVLVIPSLNSTEAFGLVQIEAMMNNVPCVASALPGVRQPVTMHGMGKIAPIGAPSALAGALLEIFANKEKYRCDTAALAKLYDPDTVAQEYEKLFEKLR